MYAHYWDAVLDAAERRGPNAFAGTARMFYELQAKRGWLDNFYDDEDWVTLALLHAYKVSGDATYLNQAKVVFADIMNAWDTTCCGAHPGGLWWEKPTMNKVTAINAGAVISASRLYLATNDSTYLAFATKAYDFWSTYMVDSTTGHVYDGMDNTGTINTAWSFTYNEGLFIGAVVELARATGDNSHLPLAHTVAGYMMTKEIETTAARHDPLGWKVQRRRPDVQSGQPARYLGELYAADPSHTEYRDFLARSGTAAWTLARDPASGDISCDWEGPYDSTTGLVGSLGSAAVGLAAAAKALGAGMQRPGLLYEAEEGDLHSTSASKRRTRAFPAGAISRAGAPTASQSTSSSTCRPTGNTRSTGATRPPAPPRARSPSMGRSSRRASRSRAPGRTRPTQPSRRPPRSRKGRTSSRSRTRRRRQAWGTSTSTTFN